MKKVAYIASECVPFIKTGGLADVVGTLPKIFDKNEYDVRVIIPNYLCIPNKYREKMQYLTSFYMDIGYKNEYVGVMYLEYEGVKVYFIDNEYYFNGFTPYGDVKWDIEKFCYFSKAALCILPTIGFQPDIVHCHDWQAGLVPVYLHTIYKDNPFYYGTKTIFTIHNLRFQGVWDIDTIRALSGLPDYVFTPDKLEFNKDANMLKGGLVYADAITTVSNTYAEEIKTQFYGEGLDGLMRARANDLRGIVNGIDYVDYNPDTDKNIVVRYNYDNVLEKKIHNKRAIQAELGLAQDDNRFMIGIVSRLTDQKGFDLIAYMMERMCEQGIQFVVLGTGEQKYEDMFRWFAGKYPDRVSANIYYSEEMSHRIYASADAFLMPSLFEPCGLSQLMSLRYGTLPIVRETGGLRDTVQPFNQFERTGTGFSFANYNAHEMYNTVMFAKYIFDDRRDEWNGLIKSAMAQDFSWQASANKYQEMYDWLIG